jgi:hypothetical protein
MNPTLCIDVFVFIQQYTYTIDTTVLGAITNCDLGETDYDVFRNVAPCSLVDRYWQMFRRFSLAPSSGRFIFWRTDYYVRCSSGLCVATEGGDDTEGCVLWVASWFVELRAMSRTAYSLWRRAHSGDLEHATLLWSALYGGVCVGVQFGGLVILREWARDWKVVSVWSFNIWNEKFRLNLVLEIEIKTVGILTYCSSNSSKLIFKY